MAKKQEDRGAARLIQHMNDILERFLLGETFRQVAAFYNVPLTTFHDFISKPEHSARVRVALEDSAQSFEDMAEQVLLDITKDCNNIEMQRARELAHHYRWKAAKRNPKKYSDKLDVTSAGEKITANIEWIGTNKPKPETNSGN